MKKILLISIVILAVVLVLASFAVSKAEKSIVCTRVVDGDTIVVSGNEKVRLIGIDTPEVYDSQKLNKDIERTGSDKKTIQELGEKASEYAKKMLDGKKVRLEYDPNNEYIKHKDKYGRTLAYVYLEDGTFFNAKIIQDGYAYAYTKYPFKYRDEFVRYEKEARDNHRGLWAGEDFQKGRK